MGKFFTVDVIPTLDCSKNQLGDAFGNKFVLFDWTAIQLPRGANKLISVGLTVRGIDGGTQTARDMDIVFAKSIKGVAPVTLGTQNETVSGNQGLTKNIIAEAHIESADYGMSAFDYFNVAQTGGGAGGSNIPMCVLEGEPTSGDNVGYDTIYVGGITGGAFEFGTAVLTDAAVDVSGLSAATLTGIDGTSPLLCFAVGDIIHATVVSDANAGIILGEIASMDANNITFRHDGGKTLDPTGNYTVPADLAAWKIQNGAGAAGDLEDNAELLNIHPIKITLSFEK